ncbi:MAG: SpoIIE family protein phosphatase [Bacteroidota bacterium]
MNLVSRYFSLLLPIILVLASTSLIAQNEKGVLNIRNYTPREYGAHAQNLCIAQDNRGVLYFGNNRGILEYDGTYWRIIRVSNETSVSAIAVDDNGKVFAGADNELGFLVPDKAGKLGYVSLVPQISEKAKDFGRIHQICATPEGIFFQSAKFLFRWDGKKMSHWDSEKPFHKMFFTNGQLFVKQKGQGLMVFKNNAIEPYYSGDLFSRLLVYDISFMNDRFVVSTNDSGVFIMKNGKTQVISTGITNVNCGISINDKYYSIGLFGDGLVILNDRFEPDYHIGLTNGLQDGTVNDQFVDHEGNLWLALNRGIAKIELITPITVHNYDTGLKGTVQAIKRHKGILYVATQNGLFYLSPSNDNRAAVFRQVENLSLDCYGIESFALDNDTLLMVAGVDGIYEINNFTAKQIVPGAPWDIKQSQTYKNRLIIAQDYGLSSIVRKEGMWEEETNVDSITEQVFNFVEEKNGTLWLGTFTSGVIKTSTKIFSDPETKIERYGRGRKLPPGPVYIYPNSDHEVLFGTDSGLYELNEKEMYFFKNTSLGLDHEKTKLGIHRISRDNDNALWLVVFYENNSYDVMYQQNGKWFKTPFLRYKDEIIQAIYHDHNNITWLGSATGLLRYDKTFEKKYDQPFIVAIRRIVAGGVPVFEGAFYNKDSLLVPFQLPEDEFLFEFSENNVTIDFSALTYYDEKSTLYSYMLDGQDAGWSKWSSSPVAVFTNIHEGSYTFKVKAKNVYGIESAVTELRFTVFPPWYRTIWAYVFYVIFFIAFVWGAIFVSTRSLRRIIQERTAEVVKQKEEIEQQKEIVEEKNRDILDSIRYAKRIQDAILPDEERMKDVLGKDMFVVYRPKDIVSGDFYWMRVKGNKVLFAAVDCTGHGVPGAFVSLVGNNGLNRTVNEFGLMKPAEILDNLTTIVEDAFRSQGHGDVRDGMDISLCSLEMLSFNESLVEWSGANNPLWLIKKDNPTEVKEIKADKQPIGKFEMRKPYSHFEEKLQKGDTLYIFTDGYADQFGGPSGKKFKYSQLKELLISNFDRPMHEQKEIIIQRFDAWKEGVEQIDDVCIIGVRI